MDPPFVEQVSTDSNLLKGSKILDVPWVKSPDTWTLLHGPEFSVDVGTIMSRDTREANKRRI